MAKVTSARKKKKRTPLFGDNTALVKATTKAHEGILILPKSNVIYTHDVPSGKEDYLFQYDVVSVSTDLKTTVIAFDSWYIIEGRHQLPRSTNWTISNMMQCFLECTVHLVRENKVRDDKQDTEKKTVANLRPHGHGKDREAPGRLWIAEGGIRDVGKPVGVHDHQ